jgi:hypothetical protein
MAQRLMGSVVLDERSGITFDNARATLSALGGIASQADLAKRWGVSPQRVHQLVHEAGFPRTAGRVNGERVWFAAEADGWRAERRNLVRRPGTRQNPQRQP